MAFQIFQDIWDYVLWFYDTKIHFLQLHYFYIFVLSFISSAFFYFQPGTHWNYIDALFMATSATTNTGLNTVNMSKLTRWHLIVMFLSSVFGSHITISMIILFVRKHYFSKRFEDILIYNKTQRLREANRRKFEKNVLDIEKQQQKVNGSVAETPRPLRKRLSFISVRSSPNGDIDNEESELSTDKKITGIQEIIHHFRKKSPSAHTLPNIRNSTTSLECPAFSQSRPAGIIHSPSQQAETDSVRSKSTLGVDSQSPTGIRISSSIIHHDPSVIVKPIYSRSPSHNSNLASNNRSTQISDSGTLPHLTADVSSGDNTGHNQGIAFAENIERQREVARRRLEQDRRFEDILQRIASDSADTAALEDQGVLMDAESEDDEEMKRIMREPIHKSELTRQQRYRLGGAEYRAIVFLTRLVPAYYLFCCIGFGFVIRIYVAASSYAQQVLQTSNTNGPVNSWTYSFFCSMSSFNNMGLVPLDASMIPFQSAPGLLIPVMFLILAGNTAYAIFLRLIIWIMYKLTPKSYVMRKETFRYLLDHPRRCYTTLFPATQTRWLLLVLIAITLAEIISFLALNYWLPVLNGIDWGARILDGIFQSVATRNAGYSIVDLMQLNPGTQIVFIIAMYISVYPVAISMRNSNVYQERALGIYKGENEDEEEHQSEPTSMIHRLKRTATLNSVMTASKKVLIRPNFFVMTQIQRQLTSEIGWVVFCIFAICVIEAEAIMSPSAITMSSVIYECVSAFGNVGASTGFPGFSASQSQQYHPLSKLVLIILMFRGRHRGLPAAIDRAVLLPSEQLEEKEQQDHLMRRRTTSISNGDGNGEPVKFYTRSLTL